jgi:hypothetical protein
MKKITLLFFFAVPVFFASGQSLKNIYIKLQYNGDGAKPFPLIYFYLPGSGNIGAQNFYTSKFEITENAYNEIRKFVVNEGPILKDTAFKSSYQFTFVGDGETTIFLTTYLSRLTEIFQFIIEQFRLDSKTQGIVRRKIDSALSRLKYEVR